MTEEFARFRREVIRAIVIWAAILLFINWLSFKSVSHSHPRWHLFRLNGVQMRTDDNEVQVFNPKSGKWTSYSKMLEEVKK